MNKSDVYIKDEGDFAIVIFETQLAHDVIGADEGFKGHLEICDGVGGDLAIKLIIANESINSMIAYCISHNLSCQKF